MGSPEGFGPHFAFVATHEFALGLFIPSPTGAISRIRNSNFPFCLSYSTDGKSQMLSSKLESIFRSSQSKTKYEGIPPLEISFFKLNILFFHETSPCIQVIQHD